MDFLCLAIRIAVISVKQRVDTSMKNQYFQLKSMNKEKLQTFDIKTYTKFKLSCSQFI